MTESSFPICPPQRDGWESLKVFFRETVPEEDAVAGAVIAISRCKRDDFLEFNPHLHVLCSDGCFYGEGMFRVAPRFTTKTLWKRSSGTRSFPRCAGLLSKGKITEDLIQMLLGWQHSVFNVFCGSRIQPGKEKAMENLTRYIIRALPNSCPHF